MKALNLLGDILKAMSQGKPISIVPLATEVTTQKASEILGCSRLYLVKLLEEVIDIEKNPFKGIIIAIRDQMGRIFFGEEEYFLPA